MRFYRAIFVAVVVAFFGGIAAAATLSVQGNLLSDFDASSVDPVNVDPYFPVSPARFGATVDFDIDQPANPNFSGTGVLTIYDATDAVLLDQLVSYSRSGASAVIGFAGRTLVGDQRLDFSFGIDVIDPSIFESGNPFLALSDPANFDLSGPRSSVIFDVGGPRTEYFSNYSLTGFQFDPGPVVPAVPLPASGVVLVTGLALLALRSRRQRQ